MKMHTYKSEFSSIHSEYEYEHLRKFNIFTSSFYNGLDIILDHKATVIILTDYGWAKHSLVDPQTDVVQILGRFRNKLKQAFHINNCKRWTRHVSEEAALERINFSLKNYEFISGLIASSTIPGENSDWLRELQKRSYPYATLLDKYGAFSYYKSDNYHHETRTKNHYTSPFALKKGYQKQVNGDDSNIFDISEDNLEFDPETLIKLSGRHSKYSRTNIQRFTTLLEQIEVIEGTNEYAVAHELVKRYLPVVHEAYHKLGSQTIADEDYRIKKIRLALLKLDSHNKMNSNAMIEAVYLEFRLNVKYTSEFIKEKLQAFYTFFEIEKTAVATDIEYYFIAHYCNKSIKGKSHRAYVFSDYKFATLSKYNRM